MDFRDSTIKITQTAGIRMKSLTTEAELDAFCTMAQTHPFVTIDSECLRERTYYS
jgi:hypothetical protein